MSRGHGYVEGHVSVVIVCFNRVDLTRACFHSIFDSDDLPDEIVFVDNASTDETALALPAFKRNWDTSIQVATLTENVGWGRGANIGSQLAEGEYLLHLNNDTEVHENWLTPLVEAMDEKTAVVAGKLLNPDGSTQHEGIRLFYDSNGTLTAENMREPGEFQALSLAAALVRADAWNQLGGIDPLFRNGYEDVDFCLRARAAGWDLKYVPESVVMHYGSASGPERWTHVQDNIAMLNQRWAGTV